MELEGVLSQIITFVADWGLQVIGALVLLVVGMTVAKLVRRGVRKSLSKTSIDATLQPFLAGLVYYLAIAVVVIAVLNLFGIQTTSLVAVLGAAGLAIGLALQGTLSNFSSGVMLLLFRPISLKDRVEAAGVMGDVLEIGLFFTTMKTPDNIKITVPNSMIFGDVIQNYTGFETRRLDLVMGIDYGDDIQTAIEACERIVREDPRVLEEPAPLVAVSSLGASSVDLMVRPWCKSTEYLAVKRDLTRALKEGIEAAGCSFPFPQRDVHLHPQGSGEPS